MIPLKNAWPATETTKKQKYFKSAKKQKELRNLQESRKEKRKHQSMRKRNLTLQPKNPKRRDMKSVKISRKKPITPNRSSKRIKSHILSDTKKGYNQSNKEYVRLIHPSQTSFIDAAGKRQSTGAGFRRGRKQKDENSFNKKFRINSGTTRPTRRSASRVTSFPKNPKKKKQTKALVVNVDARKSQKSKWSNYLKEEHHQYKRLYKTRMKAFLEKSQFQYYFNKILSIKPPKNDVLPLYLNSNTTGKPLLIIVYEGILGFDYKDPKAGVDWFLKNKLPDRLISQHLRASGSLSFLKTLVFMFELVIIMPKKNEFYKGITQKFVNELGEYLAGVYYIRVQNKKTKTVDIKNIVNNFALESTKKVVYLAPIKSDVKEIQLRRTSLKRKILGEAMKDCKILTYSDFWGLDRIIPMNSGQTNSKIILCFVPHLNFKKFKPTKNPKHKNFGVIDHNFKGLPHDLENIEKDLTGDIAECVLPDYYHILSQAYNKESLCEHHAIMKLLLSQTPTARYEAEMETLNMAHNYKKIKLFEKMRDLQASEQDMQNAMFLMKRNQKNLNNMAKYMRLGETIDVKKMPIFKQLIEFSEVLSVKNMDLDAVVSLSENMYLL